MPPASAAAASGVVSSIPDAHVKMEYAKKKDIHHLFELLAHRVLENRPDDVFKFLRDQLTEIEGVENRRSTYDPTEMSHAPKSSASSSTTGGAQQDAVELKKITIGVFGLDNAGKTSLIASIGGEATKNTTPTVGFTPTYLETADAKVCIFDLGGGSTFRGIWPHYFHDCHGIIFVVDASDTKRVSESSTVFRELVNHEYIKGKPIVVYCNKRDIAPEGAIARVTGPQGLDVANLVGRDTPTKIVASCAVADSDPAVEEGAAWLLTAITDNYPKLSSMITDHSAAVKKAKAERLAEQRRRVEENKAAEAAASAAAASK